MKFLAQNVIGQINNPLNKYGGIESGGMIIFFTNILRLIFVIGGIYAFINFIIAGFQYMTAGGDHKAMGKAWERIWQTLLGLIIVVSSFAIAALIGQIFFGDVNFILKPTFYGPGN